MEYRIQNRIARALGVVALCMLALAAATFAAPARASTYTVGAGGSCDYSTIANALTAAENSAGADTIRIVRDTSFDEQSVQFTTSQELTITGGYADCTTNTEDSTYTTIDGAGGAHASVFRITGNTGALIRMHKLTISHGDVTGDGRGGGIYFTGDGELDIADTTLSFNEAGFGGGIAVNGNGTNAELVLGSGTNIAFNTAHYNGGGVHSEDVETVIEGDNVWIDFNDAMSTGGSGGYGGGLDVRACDLASIVYLGSPGVGGAGVIYGNSARYGGGVVVEVGDDCDGNGNAELRMYSTDAARLTKIDGNTASIAGGGVFLNPQDSSERRPVLFVGNASIVDNVAPQGAALFLNKQGSVASSAYFNSTDPIVPSFPASAVACAFGVPCGRIDGNLSDDDGRVISGSDDNYLDLRRMELSGNHGSELIRLEDAFIDDCLVVQNEATAALIHTNHLNLRDSTIAANTIGGAETLAVDDGNPELHGLVVWQPGTNVLDSASDPQADRVHDIVANEVVSLFHLTPVHLLAGDPRFVDPANGDFTLTAGSPAVDFSTAVGGDDRDLYGHTRSIDLALVPDRYGPRDAGALEREILLPLVQNGNFDVDLRNWDEWDPSQSVWDATHNTVGVDGSGSLKMHVDHSSNGEVIHPRVQCVHIPGPGIYALNGYGLSSGPIPIQRDSARLLWQYRSYGDYTENCFAGDPTRSGEFTITTGTSWTQADEPAYIEVPATEWSRYSTVLIFPGAAEHSFGTDPDPSITAWIDGITLVPVDSIPDNDEIFANGFE